MHVQSAWNGLLVLSLKDHSEWVCSRAGLCLLKVFFFQWWSGCGLLCRNMNSVLHRVRHGFLWGFYVLKLKSLHYDTKSAPGIFFFLFYSAACLAA